MTCVTYLRHALQHIIDRLNVNLLFMTSYLSECTVILRRYDGHSYSPKAFGCKYSSLFYYNLLGYPH